MHTCIVHSSTGTWRLIARGAHRTSTMEHTAQALLALSLLRSLPNWAAVAEMYGDIEGHLEDLADDLSRNRWEELA